MLAAAPLSPYVGDDYGFDSGGGDGGGQGWSPDDSPGHENSHGPAYFEIAWPEDVDRHGREYYGHPGQLRSAHSPAYAAKNSKRPLIPPRSHRAKSSGAAVERSGSRKSSVTGETRPPKPQKAPVAEAAELLDDLRISSPGEEGRDGERAAKASHAREARALVSKKASTTVATIEPAPPQHHPKSRHSSPSQSGESSPSQAYEAGHPPQQLVNWEYRGGRYITIRADRGLLGWWQGKRACLLRVHVHVSSAERVDKLRVRLSFVPQHGDPGQRGPVKVFFFGPRALYGGESVEQRLTAVGGGAKITGGMAGVLGGAIEGHGSRQTLSGVSHQQTLHGWTDCEDNISNITWEAGENGQARKGVPPDLVLAAVVQYKADKGVKVLAEARAPSNLLHRRPEARAYTIEPDAGNAHFSEWGKREWRATGMTCELESR